MDLLSQYRSKLKTAAEAVKIVKNGDWVDYGSNNSYPPALDAALAGLIVGTLCMTVFGSAFNAIYLLPKFAALFGMPMDAIIGMGTKVNARINSVSTLVLFAVVPFNLLKGVIVSGLTFLLYKRISPLLHKGDDRRKKRRAEKAA